MPHMRISIDFDVPAGVDCLDIVDDVVIFIQEQEYSKAEGAVMELDGKKILDMEYIQVK